MTDAETIIARVLLDHDTWDHNCVCGEQASDPSGHVAAEVARALRDAALLPEATTRVEWGVRDDSPLPPYKFGSEEAARLMVEKGIGTLVRRAVTTYTYADHVTEWEPAE